MSKKAMTVQVGGRTMRFETGQIARQASGAVLVGLGDTLVFASACGAKEADPDAHFFPLRVDYQEKFSSVGKTVGGFIKREGRPTEHEILVSRLIDRPLRPMFPQGYRNEVQILSYVWSFDGQHLPDAMAICAASAALSISEIPLIEPIAAVRVGRIDGVFVINPSAHELNRSDLDLVVAGSERAILMIEGSARFLPEEAIAAAIELAQGEIAVICRALERWRQEVGKPKVHAKTAALPGELIDKIRAVVASDLSQAVRIYIKGDRDTAVNELRSRVMRELVPLLQEEPSRVSAGFSKVHNELIRAMILDERVRCDGRGLEEIRPIEIELAPLPRAHGSCLFTRGETQTLAVCTLGGESMSQRFESLIGEGVRRFYLQYTFPPFCVGETGRVGGLGRREVGHGKLAERALEPALSIQPDFPYVVRLESNITESNGSSSMASVCGGCLALMDAGIAISQPIAGIAMGLILEGERVAILSDILGVEDAIGDMDFKVAGSSEGITALQMDTKVTGISSALMQTALDRAKSGRLGILTAMKQACPQPREELSPFAPRIECLQIRQNKIAVVIGPGGKQIRAIKEQTGAEIDVDDARSVICISAGTEEALRTAKEIIQGLIAEVEIGATYRGKIKSIAAFGAFVEVLPNKEGLCHISELANHRVANVEEVCKLGEELTVKVLDVNERGQIKLSHKAALASPFSKL